MGDGTQDRRENPVHRRVSFWYSYTFFWLSKHSRGCEAFEPARLYSTLDSGNSASTFRLLSADFRRKEMGV